MVNANRSSALDAVCELGRFGGDGTQVSVTLREYRAASIAQIHGTQASELASALSSFGYSGTPTPRQSSGDDKLRLLWNGPDQWLAVTNQIEGRAFRDKLAAALTGPNSTITDLSQARTVIDIQGASAQEVLLKGCSIDLEQLPDNSAIATQLAYFSALIDCKNAEHYRVFVFRSFGRAFWEWLHHEAAEFGFDILASH